MKITIEASLLSAAASTAARAVSTGNTLPVLSHLLLRVLPGRLSFTGDNLDYRITACVTAEVSNPVADGLALPAAKLCAIAKALSGSVTLSVDGKNTVTIAAGGSRFVLNSLPEEEFPKDVPVTKPAAFSLPGRVLADALTFTHFTQSTDASRYVLNGTFMELDPAPDGSSLLTFVATDGRRLARHTVRVSGSVSGRMIVPLRVVQVARQLAGVPETTVVCNAERATLSFGEVLGAGSEVALTTKLVEGAYPNYRQVIPEDDRRRVTVSRAALALAVRRAALMTNDASSSIKLNFTRGNLQVTSCSPEVGSAAENVPLEWPGGDLSLGLNPDYVAQVLDALGHHGKGENVTLGFMDELSPMTLRVAESEDCLHVIMPMRLT